MVGADGGAPMLSQAAARAEPGLFRWTHKSCESHGLVSTLPEFDNGSRHDAWPRYRAFVPLQPFLDDSDH